VTDLSDIGSFVSRNWTALERARRQPSTPTEALRTIENAADLIRAANPNWPGSAARDADLADHIRLAQLLRRAG